MSHAKLSPSSSSRWLTCTASPGLIEELTRQGRIADEDSPAAAEGTLAHSVCEADYLQQPLPKGWTDEMLEGAGEFSQVIHDLNDQHPDLQVYIEKRVHLGRITDQVWGTADAICYSKLADRLVVVDYKFGRIPVDPTENTQLLTYLLGAHATLQLPGPAGLQELVIVQPRDNPSVKRWQLPPGYLLDTFLPRLTAALASIESGPDYAPDADTCRFCPALAHCEAARKIAHQALSEQFKPLTDENLAEAMTMVPLLKKWIAAVEDGARDTLLQGIELPGYKLVESITRRKWTSEHDVMAALKGKYKQDDIAPRVLLSPAKMGQTIKPQHWETLESLITKPDGKPTVAPEADKRPAIGPLFNEVED